MSLFAARTLARRGSELGKPRIVGLSHFACELGLACEEAQTGRLEGF